MQRTYRSKKDAGGGVEYRDLLLSVDEKSSAFNAFYIKNIKQTKRELSCLGSTNTFNTTNKVRKRKFVKRLVKEVDYPRRESSTYLTPDKSIHVKRAPDLFDQLLDSPIPSSGTPRSYKIFDKPKMTGKTYGKKKCTQATHKKSFNNSNSDKENDDFTKSQNMSDIRSHKLLITKEPDKPALIDTSIINIQNQLTNLNEAECSFSKPIWKNRLTKNVFSPLKNSPLCSTPFNKKYRGKSIYNFSPIPMKGLEECTDPKSEETIVKIDNTADVETSPIIHLSTDFRNCKSFTKPIIKDIFDNRQSTITESNLSEIGTQEESAEKHITNPESQHKSATCEEITEVEPFIGFTNSIDKLEDHYEILEKIIENDVKMDIETHSYSSDNLKSETIRDSDDDSSDTSAVIKKSESLYNTCSSEENVQEVKIPIVQIKKLNDSLVWRYYKVNEGSGVTEDNDKTTEHIHSRDSSQTSNESRVTQRDGYSKQSHSSSHNSDNTDNSCESAVIDGKIPIVRMEKLNDSLVWRYYKNEKVKTLKIDSDNSSTSINDVVIPENKISVVQLDKLSNSTVWKYYNNKKEKTENVDSYSYEIESSVSSNNDCSFQSVCSELNDDTSTSETDSISTEKPDEIYEENYSVMSENSLESNKSLLDDNNKIYDTSINSDNLENEAVKGNIDQDKQFQDKTDNLNYSNDINDMESHADDERFISFVTTRRRKNNVNTSMISINNSYCSTSSSDCNKTVLSRHSIAKPLRENLNENNPILQNKELLESNNDTTKANCDDCGTSDRKTRWSLRKQNADIEKTGIKLQPGKKWERSLSIYRRMTMMNDGDTSILDEDMNCKGRKYRQSIMSSIEMFDLKGSLHDASINSRRSTFVCKPSRSTIRIVRESIAPRISICSTTLDDLKGFLEDCDDTIIELSKLSIADSDHDVTVLDNFHDTSNRVATARDYVLRRCNQTAPILFDECYPDADLKNCRKIGEGVYGEVFLWRAHDGRARVMKIVPIAGNVKVNGENQKDFQEIISEIVIAMELSALRAPIAEIERNFNEGQEIDSLDLHSIENATDVFNEVLAVRCVYGSYPSRLLDLWELYDECNGSENDTPAILPPEQLYIVLELANAGQDLESYQFNSAEQAHALFLQVGLALAVAEEAYQFEHRDLHWGNVLIAPTDQKYASFVVRGRCVRVARCGVAATIIDYSLSRLSLPLPLASESAALYNDLAHDDGLFDATGDYQFTVYRLMRDKLGNEWKNFEPYTNVLWLHYTLDKMITALRYKRTSTKLHKQYLSRLKGLRDRVLAYGSAGEFVLTDNEY